MDGLGLLEVLAELQIEFVTFPDRGLDRHMGDRDLWNYCQANDLVLLTENRNHENENSLDATIQDSWREGRLPVLTLANKGRFENSPKYAEQVAKDMAELLFTIFHEGVRDRPRIFVPI
ncbi:hypothetical protein FRUB_03018 [Fimbriiglobus ruber]|uniref:DUF5615 domain-containing protein n=2 Tax=Fimbriiglobus ruber TaxID=1908690 RepID=A0A225E1R1_9BACT|nr:hypothetical protein FRUB_03018 [Fimbriiglobus ruber]